MMLAIGEAIGVLLSNLPGFLFVGALVVALLVKGREHFAGRLLRWLLLLSVGVQNVWFGLFHIFLPDFAASTIGWKPSPFQFEIGAADFSLGMVGIVSFWRSLDFKAAVVLPVTLFYTGVAIGHVYQAIWEGDMAPNNFGVLLLLTIVEIFLLPCLYVFARAQMNAGHNACA